MACCCSRAALLALTLALTVALYADSLLRMWDAATSPVMPKWNWQRSHKLLSQQQLLPETAGQLASMLAAVSRQERQIRPVGSGHSWSNIAVPDDMTLSLERMAAVLSVDTAAGVARVQAGCKLHDLAAALQSASPPAALPVLPSVDEQTIAGAISTATHGTGIAIPNLSAFVKELTLVTVDGRILRCSEEENADVFAAARVGLGALGVIAEVVLKVVPLFHVREQRILLPDSVLWDQAALDALLQSNEQVKLWWVPHTGKAVRFLYNRSPDPPSDPLPPSVRYFTGRLSHPLQALCGWLPALTPSVNQLLTLFMHNETRVGTGADMFVLPMHIGIHAESEYAVPVAHTAHVLSRLAAALDEAGLAVNHIVEVRFVAADSIWLSPDYGDSARAHITLLLANAPAERQRRYWQLLEDAALPFGGRPHWGKDHTLTGSQLASLYPRWQQFVEMREQMDPQRVLDNDYLRQLFGDGDSAEDDQQHAAAHDEL